jgi:hypothetical protein
MILANQAKLGDTPLGLQRHEVSKGIVDGGLLLSR